MSWMDVALKDFEDASRSMLLLVLSVLMVLVVAGVSAIPQLIHVPGQGPAPGFADAMSFLFTVASAFITIMALIVGYQAVVGERESGTIRFLIGLPNTRRDVVIGKVVGRATVVAVPTLVGFVVGGLVVAILYDGFEISTYVSLLGFSILLGLVYVSVAVGISAAVSTRAKAVAGVLGFWIIFDMFWWTVPMAIYWVRERVLPGPTDLPIWYVVIERIGVWESLQVIVVRWVDIAGVETIPTTERLAGDVPFYLETWFAWILVLLWIVVPIAIGYWRFHHATIS